MRDNERVGLSTAEVAAQREAYGWNELPRIKGPSPLLIALRQFKGFLVAILAVAALIAYILGEGVDAVAITLVLILNAALGFVQEWRAETTLEALRSVLSPTAVVVRDGEELSIPAREIVPGDLVLVSAGETIPADVRLVTSIEAQVDESILTGESVPVSKSPDDKGDAALMFAGTALVTGRALGHATHTGLATRFGKVAELTSAVGEKETNLQRRLGQLARQIGIASVAIAAGVIGFGLYVGRPFLEVFMTGLSLAVAMVPEGLPAVVTITLALGASAMARKNALARRLQAIETLGAASVICTDKTGTLTENKITASAIWTIDRQYSVTGTGYDPAGHIATGGHRLRADDDPVLAAILETSQLANNASLRHDAGKLNLVGAPTDGALVVLAYKGWAPKPAKDAVVSERPFSSERKRMSVLARNEHRYRVHAKGAPEVILDRSVSILSVDGARPMTDADRAATEAANSSMASQGLRVVAIAARDATQDDDLDDSLTLLGLVGMIDPPRAEVPEAIAKARAAGIKVIMITGDSPVTAGAIAENVGLGVSRRITGPELDEIPDADLMDRLRDTPLFARTRPEHKLRIVEALQRQEQIVAMTGDGVNDAPALKRADVGIAMGQRGTDVSKNAADLVLLDDNFATIVNAIAEGRRQFDNVRKFVRYLLSSNAGEVIAIVVNLALGGPLVFLPTQILWMNLITDSVTAVALGLEKSEEDQIKSPPRKIRERILGNRGALTIAAFGAYTGTASLWLFYTMLPVGEDLARTAAFTGMVVFEKVSVFAFRSLTQPCWKIGWTSNPTLLAAFLISFCLQLAAIYWQPMQIMLRTVPLGWDQWMPILVLALPLIVVPELLKPAFNKIR